MPGKFKLNKAKLDGDGNIVIQDVSGSDITIHLGNSEEVKELLDDISSKLDSLNTMPQGVMTELLKAMINAQPKQKEFNVEVSVATGNDSNDLIPKFLKTKTEYKLKQSQPAVASANSIISSAQIVKVHGIFGSSKVNHAYCALHFIIRNCGERVLEDWKLEVAFDPDAVRVVADDFPSNPFQMASAMDYRTTFAYEDEKVILYKPLNNSSLIQRDSKSFKCFCIPKIGCDEVRIQWTLLARDFSLDGEEAFKVNPVYETESEIKWVDSEEFIRTEEKIEEYITEED